MKIKNIIFFVLAAAVFFLAAAYKWGDSAHSIGLINIGGGEVKHPSFFESGKSGYTLLVTATVISPYRGDAKAVLEGEPKIDCKLYSSGPVVDVGFHRKAEFKDDTFYGLQQGDRIALWVVMKSPVVDPVCGMAYTNGFVMHTHNGKDYFFCSKECLEAFKKEPEKYKDRDGIKGKYTLALYDSKSGESVLRIPVIFKGKGDAKDAGGHHN